MGLTARAVARLGELGIVDPTPIQSQATPAALDGRDVLGLAQTGTGKTGAFALPLIHALETDEGKVRPKRTRSLILAPTRELARQLSDAIANFAERSGLKIGVVTGGASITMQRKRLGRGVDILIATPGRLIDLLDRHALVLDDTRFLVLDEADQMLDMGFIHALNQIAPLLPADRQTLLFSATMPKQMSALANAYLSNPIRVEVARPGLAADKVEQSVHFVAQSDKRNLLQGMLDAHRGERALVFARTKHGAERLSQQLARAGLEADSIHGDKRQRERQRTLDGFREGRFMVLVATDVAARGLDIPDVRYIYNFDLPNVAENYVHRIGRTARAGAAGKAIAFCAAHEMADLGAIEKAMGTHIPVSGGEPWRRFNEKAGRPKRAPARRRFDKRPDSRPDSRPDGGRPDANRRPKRRPRRAA